jgi:predicted nucleic acid-binding protein
MIRCLVDTDVLIDASRGAEAAIEFLSHQERQRELAVRVITHMELMAGCRNTSELREVNRFLQRFAVIPINELISTLAVRFLMRYRLSYGLLIPDAFVAATASAGGYWLATRNLKHFQNIRGLKLLSGMYSKK